MAIGSESGIGWTNQTWNVLAGCRECDPGCFNCYAKNVAQRLANIENTKTKYLPTVENGEWTGKITVTEKEIVAPLRQSKSQMIFANSMSDLFYKEVPDELIDIHIVVMYLAKWQFFQILTKREKRMRRYFEKLTANRIYKALEWLIEKFELNPKTVAEQMPNCDPEAICTMENAVWMVSASDQAGFERRAAQLLGTPYLAKRGVSLEPMIGRIDARPFLKNRIIVGGKSYATNRLEWIILGGESTKLLTEIARPLPPDFAATVIADCQREGVPVFFKQWGDWLPVEAHEVRPNYKGEWILVETNGTVHRGKTFEDAKNAVFSKAFINVGKDKAGNEIDGEKYEQFPEIKFGEYINYFQKK